jgi:hypothetical protein
MTTRVDLSQSRDGNCMRLPYEMTFLRTGRGDGLVSDETNLRLGCSCRAQWSCFVVCMCFVNMDLQTVMLSDILRILINLMHSLRHIPQSRDRTFIWRPVLQNVSLWFLKVNAVEVPPKRPLLPRYPFSNSKLSHATELCSWEGKKL